MKHLIWLALACSCFAQDIQRPSIDADSFVNCGIGHVTTAMPNSHDAAGLSTNSAIGGIATVNCNQYTCTSTTNSNGRVFKTWPTAPSAYCALTVNINSASVGWQNTTGVGGNAAIYYSTDGGVTWNTVRTDASGTGWVQTTNSIGLSASQDLTKLQVAVCAVGNGTGTVPSGSQPTVGVDNLTVWDVWTSGTTSGQGPGNGSSAGQRHNGVQIN